MSDCVIPNKEEKKGCTRTCLLGVDIELQLYARVTRLTDLEFIGYTTMAPFTLAHHKVLIPVRSV